MGSAPKKKKRKLTPWNKFIRDNSSKKKFQLPNGAPDLKKMSKAFHAKSGTKPKSKSKPKAKSKERTRTTKPKPKKRRRGPLEIKIAKMRDEFADMRYALGIPKSQTHFKIVSGTWRLRLGSIKVKRRKLAEAMKVLRQKVKKRL